MTQAKDTVWLPVLPSMKDFGPALAKGAGAEADKSGKAVGARFGKALIVGTAAVGAAAVGAGAALYKVGEVFDDVADTIRVGTGATGAALDGLVDSAKNVGKSVPADFEKVGTVVADINTRLGLSGATLETVASQYLEAGRILGEEVDVTKTSAAFSAFKIEGEGVIGAMDHLFQVSQATGVGMNELAEGAARNAPAMEILGFSFEETTAMIGSFDKAGLNSSALMASMSKGMVTLAKDGEEPAAAFKRVQEEIAGFVAAGDDAAALDLAAEVFGTKGASQFIGAVKSGALNLEDMSKAAGQTGDSILGVGAETMDFAEQWQLFKNNVLVWLEPMGARVFGALGTIMGEVTGGVKAFGAAWKYNDGEVTSSGIPGVMERLGFYARQAFDYFNTTALPVLRQFGGYITGTLIPNMVQFSVWITNNRTLLQNIALVIGIILLPTLIRLGTTALISGGQQVAAWAMSQAGAVQTGVVYAVQSLLMIGRWVAMGAAALISGAQTAYVWGLYRLEALSAGVVYALQSARVIAAWVAMSAAAIASGIATRAVWVGTVVASAVSGAVSFLLQSGRVVAGWALMGTQSLLQGARMAAAWVLAMGPLGWVIAAVIGVVAIIVANWDTLKSATAKLPAAFEAAMAGIGKAWDGLKEIAKKPVRFVVETVIGGLVDTFNKIPGVDIKKPTLPPGFRKGGYTGNMREDEVAGVVHGREFVMNAKATAAIGREKLSAMAHAATAGGGNMGGFFTGNAAQIRKHGAMYLDVAGGMGPWNFPGAAGLWDGAAGVKVKVGRGSHQAQVRPLERGGGILGFSSNTNIDMSPSWMATLGAAQRRTVAAHEIGHSLGLPHNSGNSIMQPNLANMASVPTAQDIANLQHLYPGGSGKAGAGVQENPFSGLVTKLMDQFKKQFPEGGMVVDSIGGLVKSAIEKVTKWIQDIKDGVKNVAGDVVDSIRGFFGGGAATADVPFLHDQGGVVHPGMSTILNKTRKPEALLNPQQWSDIRSLAARGANGSGEGMEFNFNGPMYGDPQHIADEIRTQQRRAISRHDVRKVMV